MADTIEAIASPSTTLKRSAPQDGNGDEPPLNLKGTQFLASTSLHTPPASDSTSRTRELSPATSISALSSIQDVSSIGIQDSNNPTLNARPAKRRKLTPAEKAEQSRQKEIKAQEKAEEKARKDELKRIQDEEKQRKAEVKEAKRREKELEEERKSQAKLKKEQSQMRLGAFFQKPAVDSAVSPEKTPVRRRSLSLETFDTARDSIPTPGVKILDSPVKTAAVRSSEELSIQSEYQKYFLPFVVKEGTTLCTSLHKAVPLEIDLQEEIRTAAEKYDLGLAVRYGNLKDYFPRRCYRGRRTLTTKTLYQQISGFEQIIDLTGNHNPREEFAALSMRQIHFDEDVRPAYCGTYTQNQSSGRKLARNPFAKERQDTDYDVDSEAAWEPPEPEDDNLDQEESEGELEDDEEMDDFVEDDDDAAKARRKVVDLEVQCSGLLWEDKSGRLTDASIYTAKFFSNLRLELLMPGLSGSIDPFSSAYWPSETTTVRPPLKERSTNSQAIKEDDATSTVKVDNTSVKEENGWPIEDRPKQKRAPKGTQSTMSDEEFQQFKEAVIGSTSTKAELTTSLKALFPTFKAQLIKDTLDTKFGSIGKKGSQKWIFGGAS